MPVDVITREADRVERLHGDRAAHRVAGAVAQFSAAVDHRRHRHRAARDAARTRAGSGARAHQRQAAAPERARALERQHRPRIDRRRSERDSGVGDRPHRDPADGAAAQYGSDAIAGVINIVLKAASPARVSATFGLSQGIVRRQHCTPNGLTCTAGDDIHFSDGGLVDVGGSWGSPPGRAA